MAVLELDEAHALEFRGRGQAHACAAPQRRARPARPVRRDRPPPGCWRRAGRSRPPTGWSSTSTAPSSSASSDRVGDQVAVRYFGVDNSIAERLPELQEQDVRFDDDLPRPGPDDGLLNRATSGSSRCCSATAHTSARCSSRRTAWLTMINATAAATAAGRYRRALQPRDRGRRAALDHPAPRAGRGGPGRRPAARAGAGEEPGRLHRGARHLRQHAGQHHDRHQRQLRRQADVSWLYDVSFDSLRERGVAMTSGGAGVRHGAAPAVDDVPVAGIGRASTPRSTPSCPPTPTSPSGSSAHTRR